MLHALFVLHRHSAASFSPDVLQREQSLLWQTCLRQVVIGFNPDKALQLMGAGDELLVGEQAYQFCLEVICGLHSPMVGETEVLGQFRNFFRQAPLNELDEGTYFKRLVQDLLADAKLVREKHLTGHGSQSYGSVVRRALRGHNEVVVVGSGQFTEELLPWILKERHQVQVVARNEARLGELREKFPALRTQSLAGYQAGRKLAAVVLAAPLSNLEFQNLFTAGEYDLVVDLRGEGADDPLQVATTLISLNEVFDQVKATEHLLAQKSREAKRMIKELVGERYARIENRPFGWDDLCA